MNGKGSKRRPAQVPDEQIRANWDRVFRRPRGVVHKPTSGTKRDAQAQKPVDAPDLER